MLEQSDDFQDESDALYQLLERLPEAEFDRATQFKDWTFTHIIGHLHMWNWAADLSLRDEAAFLAFRTRVLAALKSGSTLRSFEHEWLAGAAGSVLVENWHDLYPTMAVRFQAADPKARLHWVGPQMSVRSSITARLMETWAHGQAIYDRLGVERVNTDRLQNVAFLGMSTFGWTFINRGLEVPVDAPYVRLTGPSGAQWEWNEPSETNAITGAATEFCQVVTQVRNIADTQLSVTGKTAETWMSIAQCFAGPPEDPPPPPPPPPAPGTRFRERD